MTKYLLVYFFYFASQSCSTIQHFKHKEEVIQKALEYILKGDEASLDKLLLARDRHNTNFGIMSVRDLQVSPGMTQTWHSSI